mgnify:CR=1 FL=1
MYSRRNSLSTIGFFYRQNLPKKEVTRDTPRATAQTIYHKPWTPILDTKRFPNTLGLPTEAQSIFNHHGLPTEVRVLIKSCSETD